MYWIAKPFVLPLQIFFITKNNTLFQKTRTKLAATDQYWRLLTSPIVEKKHVHFPYVNSDSREKWIEYIFQYCFQKSSEKCIGSPNPLFYRCKFSRRLQTIHLFHKTRTKLAASEAYWRLLTSPIVEKNMCIFLVVVVAVVVVVVVAEDIVEDDAEDDDEDGARRR